MSTIRRLADGLYEEVVTGGLARALERVAHERHIDAPELRDDAHVILARLLRGQIERAFADVGGAGDDKLARQVQLADDLLRVLESHQLLDGDQRIASPARELRSVFPDPAARPRRPETPLATTTLLTLGHGEPRIGHELACEIDSADRVDALVSFVTKGGVRVLRDAIDRLVLRHQRGEPPIFRLITTTYTGATEAAAVEELARLPGVEVRISYDGRRTRLHAKAWLFYRRSGLTTAYVGSANLSSPALTAGLEWMVKLAGADLPHIIAKFSGAFETLWADREFQRFDPDRPGDVDRLHGARAPSRSMAGSAAMAATQCGSMTRSGPTATSEDWRRRSGSTISLPGCPATPPGLASASRCSIRSAPHNSTSPRRSPTPSSSRSSMPASTPRSAWGTRRWSFGLRSTTSPACSPKQTVASSRAIGVACCSIGLAIDVPIMVLQ